MNTGRSRRSSWISLCVILIVVVGGSEAWRAWRNAQWGREAREASTAHAQASVVMYSTRTCPYCAQARVWLDGHGVRWRECDVERDAACQARYAERGAPGTPLMEVNGQWRLGFDPAWVAQTLQAGPAQSAP